MPGRRRLRTRANRAPQGEIGPSYPLSTRAAGLLACDGRRVVTTRMSTGPRRRSLPAMPRYDFDMITIGAGSGGVASSRRAGSYGARVAICEELRVGGTCVLRGCVPKKLLVYGAQFADAFADAAGFGWSVPPADFDWPALIAAKDKEIGRLSQIYINMLNNAKVTTLDGRGVVVDPHTVEVNGKRYTAENTLVAVGGWPETPKIPGIEHVISSNEALDLPELPRRIVIVGGGYIAVEFAGIFRGLGSEVHEIIRRPDLLYGFDDDIRVNLAQEMRTRGV